MFRFFKKNSKCPVDEERRQWIDKCFIWLKYSFGYEYIKSKKIITPKESDFPFKFIGDEENAYEVIDVIAPQMDIEPDDIEIEFYTEAQNEIQTGAAYHSRIFLKQIEGEKYSSGLYWGKREDGKYHIGFETKNLNNPGQMIATLAHELAHISSLEKKGLRITMNRLPISQR